jgi:hypothetical protein
MVVNPAYHGEQSCIMFHRYEECSFNTVDKLDFQIPVVKCCGFLNWCRKFCQVVSLVIKNKCQQCLRCNVDGR